VSSSRLRDWVPEGYPVAIGNRLESAIALRGRVDGASGRPCLFAVEHDLVDRLAMGDRCVDDLIFGTAERPAAIARDLELHRVCTSMLRLDIVGP